MVRVSDFKIRGAPSVPGSILGVQGWVRVLILKSGAPHQSQAPSSEFKGGKSSDLKKSRGASDCHGGAPAFFKSELLPPLISEHGARTVMGRP